MSRRRRKTQPRGLLDETLGFTPSQALVEWVHDHYAHQVVNYREVERTFLLDVHPNFHTGVVLSIFDLCGCRIHPQKEVDLPPVKVSEQTASSSSSFIDDYIREIGVFPTLNREQELDLAKLMEVAYIRYKSSLCVCPAVLDLVDERVQEIAAHPQGEHPFHMQKFKAIVVPGTSNLTYPQLWKIFHHQWKKVMFIREKIRDLHGEIDVSGEDPPREKVLQLLTYKAAVAFVLKDLNVRESVFHDLREQLKDVQHRYPHLKADFSRVVRCYERYIECKNLMVNYNLKLVVSIARKFFRSKISPMDVIQYGNEGLIRAAEDYNYKLKFKFSTYAIWWIRQKIQEGVQEQEHMIRIPAYRLHLNRKYNAIKDRMAREGEGVVSDAQLAQELGLSEDQIKKLRNDPAAFVIAPTSGANGEEGGNVLEQLVDTRSEDEAEVYDDDATSALKRHLKIYPIRERLILALRYGLESEEIQPVELSEELLESRFAALDEDEGSVDEQMEPVLYRFDQLAMEVKVTPNQLKQIKSQALVPIDIARAVYPFTLKELRAWRDEAESGVIQDVRGRTVLAMVDGRDFAEYIKPKGRDRLTLNKICLEKAPRSFSMRSSTEKSTPTATKVGLPKGVPNSLMRIPPRA